MSPKKGVGKDFDQLGKGGEWAEGLSKGVFVYKKSKKRSRAPSPKKKAKRSRQETHKPTKDAYLEMCFASKYKKWARERVEVHDSIVAEVDRRVDTIQKKIFKGVFDSLVNLVDSSQRSTHTTIPAAVLLMGVNMPDHTKVFGQILDRLNVLTRHISLIAPGQTLKQLVTNLVMDLVNDQDEDVSVVKRADANFSFLAEWYSNQYKGDVKPPIVLVIQDFENCSGSSLNDLITLCSRYLSTLPIVMIFGVATTLNNLFKTLPQTTTSKLTINTFGSPNASLHLEEVLESVIIDPQVSFKLSGKVFQFLLENFLFHDFSVNQFLNGYRFVLGEHLSRNPAGVLLGGEKDALERVSQMDLKDLEYICTLPSFREHLEEKCIEVQAETLVNEDMCRLTVLNLLEEYFEYTKTFTVMVEVLLFLAKDMPRRPMGRLLRDVYLLALAGNIHTTQQYRVTFQFLNLSSRTELETKLNYILSKAENRPLLEPFCEKIREVLQKMQNLGAPGAESITGSPTVQVPSSAVNSPSVLSSSLGFNSPSVVTSSLNNSAVMPILDSSNLQSLDNSTVTPLMSSSNTPTGSAVNSPAPGRPGGKAGKLDRYKLQALLRETQKKMEPKLSPFDIIRSELLALLHDTLKTFLDPPSNKPLSEIFFFSATGMVRRHVAGAPRAALHTALTNPYLYLEHPDLEIGDPGEIPATLPDLCVGYKLHLECRRLINVFDWLSCWHSIMTNGQEDVTQDEHARFIRVAQELQYLGFIRSSNRKTDHVARLTFGGS